MLSEFFCLQPFFLTLHLPHFFVVFFYSGKVKPIKTGYPKRGTLANSADPDQTLQTAASDMVSTACKTLSHFLNRFLKIIKPGTPKIADELVQYIGWKSLFSLQWVGPWRCSHTVKPVLVTTSIKQATCIKQACPKKRQIH